MATKITYILTKPTATTGADDYSPYGLTPAAMDQNLANLQAAVDSKAPSASPLFTGDVSSLGAFSAAVDGSGSFVAQGVQHIFRRGSAGSLAEVGRFDTSGNLFAGVDNTQTLGSAAKRWSTVYAGTGTINTSDAREKTAVVLLTADELAATKALACEFGTFQFLDAVAEKGEDARHHAGMTVQRAIEIMQAHSLDPFRYGFICYDEWDGGSRYSFRHDELLMFIAKGFDARLAALEAA